MQAVFHEQNFWKLDHFSRQATRVASGVHTISIELREKGFARTKSLPITKQMRKPRGFIICKVNKITSTSGHTNDLQTYGKSMYARYPSSK